LIFNGVDYAWNHPTPGQLRDAGKMFAIRYITGTDDGKFLRDSERTALHAAGIAVGLTVETFAGAYQGGFMVGQNHGRLATEYVTSHLVPPSVAVFFALDQDLSTTGRFPAANSYLAGVRDTYHGKLGVYGGLVAGGLVADSEIFWQTYAWSRGGWSKRAQVRQYQNEVRLGQGIVDLCEADTLDHFWLPSGKYVAPVQAPPWGGKTVSVGSTGEVVRTVQQRLRDRGWTIDVDGQFGPQTEGVVRQFQREKGLTVDGIVGPITWRALWETPVT